MRDDFQAMPPGLPAAEPALPAFDRFAEIDLRKPAIVRFLRGLDGLFELLDAVLSLLRVVRLLGDPGPRQRFIRNGRRLA